MSSPESHPTAPSSTSSATPLTSAERARDGVTDVMRTASHGAGPRPCICFGGGLTLTTGTTLANHHPPVRMKEAKHAVPESNPSSSSSSTVSSATVPEEFGANEWLVEEMYERFQADPSSVDKTWVDYFKAHGGSENGGARNGGQSTATTAARPTSAGSSGSSGSTSGGSASTN